MERINAITTVGMLTHLANVMQSEGRVCGLSSAQADALMYFAHANRLSRTVSAFAEFHATTRGTASQTIKSLVDRGLLVRTKAGVDGRRTRLDITQEGRSLWAGQDTLGLVKLVAGLQEHQRTSLAEILTEILHSISGERDVRTFGPCMGCDYFKREWSVESSKAGDFCRYSRSVLPPSELTAICMFYKPLASGD